MTSITRRAIVGVALGLPLAACGPQAAALPEVPSLLEALPTLEAAALEWQEDAYLEDAQIQIPGPAWLTSHISAVFRSAAAGSEAVLVFLALDGTTRIERLQDSDPPSPEEAITRNDWNLDTGEALACALDEGGRRWLEDNAGAQCSFLQLLRETHFPGHSVVWRVVLKPCPLGDTFQEATIDAITGEVLGRK
jgi:hypothetical protein